MLDMPRENPAREKACLLEALVALRPPTAAHVKAILKAIMVQHSKNEANGLQINLAALIERSCCTLQIVWGQECPRMKSLSSILLELIASLGRSIHGCTGKNVPINALKGVEAYFCKLTTI